MINITPALAASRHHKEWTALERRLNAAAAAAVSAAYAPSFVSTWEDTSKKPCTDLPAQLLRIAPNIKALKLVATDSAGNQVRASLDLTNILTTQSQSHWPIELAGEDPLMREKRRAHWHKITVGRTNRSEREAWWLAGLARRPFRGGFAWCAQMVNDERTKLLVTDPANPNRLVDHALVMTSLDVGIYAPSPTSSRMLHNRIAHHYPGYLFGHSFIDPKTDTFLTKAFKQWKWFDAQSAEVADWIAAHLTPSPQGLLLILEDAPRLDVRDYRDDKAGKPRAVL